MNKLSLVMLFVIFLSSAQLAYSTGVFRLILPDLNDLNNDGYIIQEGELLFENSSFLVKSGNELKAVELSNKNHTPRIRLNSPTEFEIDAGFISIDSKIYKNTSPIFCDGTQTGPGGVQAGDTVQYPGNISLYLIPDINNPLEFDCMLSFNENGLTDPSYSNSWKRVAIIYLSPGMGPVVAENGVVEYLYKHPLESISLSPGIQTVNSNMLPVEGKVFLKSSCSSLNVGMCFESTCSEFTGFGRNEFCSTNINYEKDFTILSNTSPFSLFFQNYNGSSTEYATFRIHKYEQNVIESN